MSGRPVRPSSAPTPSQVPGKAQARAELDKGVSQAVPVAAPDSFQAGAPAGQVVAAEPVPAGKRSFAVVGGRRIREADIEEAADTLALKRAVAGSVVNFGGKLGVQPGANERFEQFQERVIAEARKKGKLEALEGALQSVIDHSRAQAALSLVKAAVLRAELVKRRVELPDVSGGDELKPLLDALILSTARARGASSPEPGDIAQVHEWLTLELDAALWAPHLDAIEPQLQGYSAEERAHVLSGLSELYFPSRLAWAAAGAAESLVTKGPAAEWLSLVRASGETHWTLGDLQNVATDSPDSEAAKIAARLLPVRAEDPVQAALTPLNVVVSDAKLKAHVGSPSPILTALQERRVEARWALNADQKVLVLTASGAKSQSVPSGGPEAAAALVGLLDDTGRAIARAWSEGPAAIEKVSQRAYFENYFHEKTGALLTQAPEIARALRAGVVRDVLSARAAEELGAKLKAAGCDEQNLKGLLELRERMVALERFHPMPAALRAVVANPEVPDFALPLAADAMAGEQREVLIALQHMMVSVGVLDAAKVVYGQLDAETRKQLEELVGAQGARSGVDAGSLELDHQLVTGLWTAFAELIHPEEQLAATQLVSLAERLFDAGLDPSTPPLRAVLCYLDGLRGETRDAGEILSGSELHERLHEASTLPVSAAALKIASTRAKAIGEVSQAQREDLISARCMVLGTQRKVFVEQSPLTSERRSEVARGLRMLQAPRGIAPVPRSEFGNLPGEEPVVALKLAVARLVGGAPPVDADGSIEGSLSASELRQLSALCLGPNLPKEQKTRLEQCWKHVVEAVERGDLCIDNLHRPQQGTAIAGDLETVLADLRQVALAIRVQTLPNDRALEAVAAQSRPIDPVSTFPQKLAAARLALKVAGKDNALQLQAEDFAQLARLAASLRGRTWSLEMQPLQRAAQAFLRRYDASQSALDRVGRAIADGRLRISEATIQSAPRDPALEAEAEQCLHSLVEGAEVARTEDRIQNSRSVKGGIERAAASASQHLFRLPGFSDALIFNQVSDWTLVSLRAEMRERRAGGNISAPEPLIRASTQVDADVIHYLVTHLDEAQAKSRPALEELETALRSGAVSPWSPTEALESLPKEQRALRELVKSLVTKQLGAHMTQLLSIDAQLLRYLADAHPDMLGRGAGDTIASGVALPLPSPQEARELLLREAARMREPWSTLNVRLGDVDPETRTAKLVVQQALTRLSKRTWPTLPLLPERDAGAIESLTQRLAGLEAAQLAPFVKGLCVLQGAASAEQVGAFGTSVLPAEGARASAMLARRAAQAWKTDSPEAQAELVNAATALEAAAQRGDLDLAKDPHGPEVKAIRTLLEHTTFAFGAKGEVKSFDFMKQLPGVDELRVRHPVFTTPPEPRPLEEAFYEIANRARHPLPWTEAQKQELRQWMDRVELDPARAVETAVGTYVLFKHLMHSMVSYDLWFAPFVKSQHALSELRHAQTQEERDNAWAQLGSVWSQWLDMQVMFSAFRTPVGFTQVGSPGTELEFAL